MLKCHEELEKEFKASLEDSWENIWQKDDIEPKDLENLKTLVENHWGNKNPKLNRSEKVIFNQSKKDTQKLGEGEWENWLKDDKEANQLSHLCWLYDDPNWKPYWQGKFNDPEKKTRGETVNLRNEWVENHFQKTFLDNVKALGKLQMTDPIDKKRPMYIPREQRWMMVPLGYNCNEDEVDEKQLRPDIPIQFPQGDEKSCLCSSLASAFAYMGHMKIAETLVLKMGPLIGVDAKLQWNGLEKMLMEIKHAQIYIAKFNFKQ